MSDESTVELDPSVPPALPLRRRKRKFPPNWILIICGIPATGAAWLQFGNGLGDHAIDNVLSLLLAFAGCLTIGLWYLFFSGYRWWTRLLTVVVGVVAVRLFFVAFEVHQVSGEMVPAFRLRATHEPDELLDVPVSVATADLSTTTEFDFPQFLGPSRDARVTGTRLRSDWNSDPPKLIWRQPIGAGWSAFAAVNGFAVTQEQRGPEELVTCYEITTGRLVWSYGVKARHATTLSGVGPRSTPTIDAGKVYAAGATGKLCCLDGATGKAIWRVDLLEAMGISEDMDGRAIAWGRSNSPLVIGNQVIVPAGGPINGHKKSLVALQKETGAFVWESGDRQISYASPVAAQIDGSLQVVSVNENNVSGHDPVNGRVLWEYDWSGQSNGNPNTSQPIVLMGDRILVSKGYGVGGMLLQLTRSSVRRTLFQVDHVWSNQRALKSKFTNLVIREGHAYGLSDGILECVDLSDGKRRWKKGRFGHGQILGVDDLLLVQAESGEVVLVEATPASMRVLSRLSGLTSKTWNNPCLSGRYLLIRNAEEACCYELPLTD
jgi:outer membrane protein assembly factor BamB